MDEELADLAFRIGTVAASHAVEELAWTLELADVGYLDQLSYLTESGSHSAMRRCAEQVAEEEQAAEEAADIFVPRWR